MNWFKLSQRIESRRARTLQMIESMRESERDRLKMRTIPEIKKDIRELRAEMKAKRVRRISCFNGGLTPCERDFNSRLFNLNTELKTVQAWQQAQS